MPLGNYFNFIMTLAPSGNLSIVDQLCAGATTQASEVACFIGVAAEKDNRDAVYFQYVGEKETKALPSNTLFNVRFTGLSVADDVYDGDFVGDKLNVYLETQNGETVMLTSGLCTWWSRSIITAIQVLAEAESMHSLVNISSYYKGMACFATVYNNNNRVTSDSMFKTWNDLNAPMKKPNKPSELERVQNRAQVAEIMRDSVAILSQAMTGVKVTTTASDDNF